MLIREVLRRLEGGPIRSHSLSPLNTQHSVSLSLSFSQSLLSLYPPPPVSLSFSVLSARPLCLPLNITSPLFLIGQYIPTILPISLLFSFYFSSIAVSLSLFLFYSVSTYFSFSQYLTTHCYLLYLSLSRFMRGYLLSPARLQREEILKLVSVSPSLFFIFFAFSVSLFYVSIFLSLVRSVPSLLFIPLLSVSLYLSFFFFVSLSPSCLVSAPLSLSPTISVYCDSSALSLD